MYTHYLDILLCSICWNVIISCGVVWNSRQFKMFWTFISSCSNNILCNQIYNNYNMQIWFAIELIESGIENVKCIFHYNPPLFMFCINNCFKILLCAKSSPNQTKNTLCLLIKMFHLNIFFGGLNNPWYGIGLEHKM